ncbi:MAG: tRNA-dihydrouridine synthase family protein [Desulfobacterales bacterium]|nr:tRNA-dihydrouridine synthase family protein [Desulfobacterales bacterium]
MNNNHSPHIYLAPLRGLTGAVFRDTYAEFFQGIDGAVAPFLTTMGTRIKPGQLKELLPENNRHMPVVPQILSKTAEKFIVLAQALFDLGYETVNWNLGCPFARVAQKKRGSGLLPHPDLIQAFLDKTLAAIPNRLSIKTRLGRRRADEVLALLPVFNAYPIQELIIHPRTGEQMYTGKPDLDSFAQCLDLCRCPVVYNGDINARDDFEKLRQRFPSVSGWMIGRGVLGDPFLPAAIKELTSGGVNRIDQFRRFHDTLYARSAQVRHGPAHLVDSMKGYWSYFAAFFPDGERILKQVRKVHGTDHYREVVDSFLDRAACQ